MLSNRVIGPRTAAAAAGAILCALTAFAPARADGFPPSFAPLVDRVKGAVVNIATTEQAPQQQQRGQGQEMPQFPPGSPFDQFFKRFGPNGPGGGNGGAPQRQQPMRALGSGFIVDPSGFVVTNNHVVDNASEVKVTLQDGTTYTAKVVGKDEGSDLAVLKIEAGHALPAVAFGDSDKSRVGDWVISVGNPFGLGWTVTAGIVSATGRDQAGLAANAYVDFIQIDAPINQGNSGGPTFNGNGEVIGINSQILSPNGGGSVGIGFAIPANIAKPIVAMLEKSGKVERGYLGVQMQPITPDMEDALALTSTNGVLVASVVPDGPAAKGGVRAGDVIVGFGDRAIKNMHDLGRDVANTPVGKSVQLKVMRESKAQTVAVTIEQRRDDQLMAKAGGPPESSRGELGLQLGALDPAIRQQLQIPQSVTGAIVTGIAPNSPAEEQGLREGDIVVRVDNTEIKGPVDVSDAVKKAGKAGKKAVALLVRRGDHSEFVAVPLTKSAG